MAVFDRLPHLRGFRFVADFHEIGSGDDQALAIVDAVSDDLSIEDGVVQRDEPGRIRCAGIRRYRLCVVNCVPVFQCVREGFGPVLRGCAPFVIDDPVDDLPRAEPAGKQRDEREQRCRRDQGAVCQGEVRR